MNVVIFGTGSHSEVILDILLESNEFNFLGFVCEFSSKEEHCGFPILTNEIDSDIFTSHKIEGGIIGLGDNSKRLEIANKIKKSIPNFKFINVISSSSDISKNVDIGNGIFAIMFPYDGHSPQHFIIKPELIKKITIKISIDK